ncbi:MAG: hypothetical protein FJ090_19995 [Deltaproteobacteria bacterium]|nr:hypothetical protein [Deltaproteobacteria bacterium]
MSDSLAAAMQKGLSMDALVKKLGGVAEGGKALGIEVEDRARPYLDHVVEGVVDGPPTSVVAFVLSGKDPAAEAWRRFTLSQVAPYTYELGVFPTPFHNGQDPLAPGVPPSSSRRR